MKKQDVASLTLEISKASVSDTFKDRVRIPSPFRQGIREGTICRISTVSAKMIVEVMGKKNAETPCIFMDLRTRKALNLKVGMTANFTIKPVGLIGQLRWASRNADPGIRVAAQLGIISLFLGVVSLIIALAGFFWHPP